MRNCRNIVIISFEILRFKIEALPCNIGSSKNAQLLIILKFVNYVLVALDNGDHIYALYEDFSKAFDRMDILMLLFKLHKMEIELDFLKLIVYYLTDQK